jgi:hypothetical protein
VYVGRNVQRTDVDRHHDEQRNCLCTPAPFVGPTPSSGRGRRLAVRYTCPSRSRFPSLSLVVECASAGLGQVGRVVSFDRSIDRSIDRDDVQQHRQWRIRLRRNHARQMIATPKAPYVAGYNNNNNSVVAVVVVGIVVTVALLFLTGSVASLVWVGYMVAVRNRAAAAANVRTHQRCSRASRWNRKPTNSMHLRLSDPAIARGVRVRPTDRPTDRAAVVGAKQQRKSVDCCLSIGSIDRSIERTNEPDRAGQGRAGQGSADEPAREISR